ncbi:hypothetical protein B5K12_18535 [Klebsiella pneumoniae subsp. pneumoniae]|nr:hypothetical protein B5K12_18535 [Klebsiella pneumoniae subsp. pneumoniae]PLF77238.1 hypothetical protein B6I99_10720 [Klebsiella quasipneumoniae]
MDKGNSLAANAACAIQRLRILPFTTGSALLQLQTDPHRKEGECAFMLCACFFPHQARWILVIPQQQGFCFSAPISPPLWFSAQTEKIAFNAVGFRHD